MDRFFKVYAAIIWFLSYVSGPNHFITSRNTAAKALLSLLGILNIVHCIFILLYLVDLELALVSQDYSLSYNLLYSIEDYVTYLALVLIRLTAVRSSASLSHTIRYLESRRTGRRCGHSKTSVLALAMLLGSTGYAMFLCAEMLQPTDVSIKRHYPALGPAIWVSTMLTDSTAIWFALSYVVVMSQELVHTYCQICLSCLSQKGDDTMQNLKLEYKLLKRFVRAFEKHATRYSFCIAVSCAVVWLGVVAIRTTTALYMTHSEVYFVLSNILPFGLLMYICNWMKTEVKQKM